MLGEKIKSLMSETDKLDELTEIIKEADALEAQIEANKTSMSEMKEKISELQDVNMKLFLSSTSDVEDEAEEEELTPEQELEKLVNLIKED